MRKVLYHPLWRALVARDTPERHSKVRIALYKIDSQVSSSFDEIVLCGTGPRQGTHRDGQRGYGRFFSDGCTECAASSRVDYEEDYDGGFAREYF